MVTDRAADLKALRSASGGLEPRRRGVGAVGKEVLRFLIVSITEIESCKKVIVGLGGDLDEQNIPLLLIADVSELLDG